MKFGNNSFCLIIVTIMLIVSCDDYCDFEFSEELFPLEVGNEWLYFDEDHQFYQRWEITDVVEKNEKNIYILSIYYEGTPGINSGYFYFDNKKLITTLYNTDNDNEENEYVLADFSLDELDTLKTGVEGAVVIVDKKENNRISFLKYQSGSSRDRYYPFDHVTFQLGKGITEYWVWGYHGNPKLIDYSLN